MGGLGGGTAILVNNWIKAERIDADLGEMEGTNVELKGHRNNLILINC